jgi:hypothetical protein
MEALAVVVVALEIQPQTLMFDLGVVAKVLLSSSTYRKEI